MNVKRARHTIVVAIIFLMSLPAVPALATQGHGGAEGVWAHQFAHLFFLFSMVLLIYWLRQAGLVKAPGWRYIQYAALFFILWNLDTLLIHFLDEQIHAVSVHNIGGWQIRIDAAGGRTWLAVVYYLGKMDHLLCVPAMICLLVGLRHMLKGLRPTAIGGENRR
jgi:hypothetical protein